MHFFLALQVILVQIVPGLHFTKKQGSDLLAE